MKLNCVYNCIKCLLVLFRFHVNNEPHSRLVVDGNLQVATANYVESVQQH
jgi:hypothetical protein